MVKKDLGGVEKGYTANLGNKVERSNIKRKRNRRGEIKKRMSNATTRINRYSFSSLSGGMDGTRTRDPLRDRQVF